MEHSLFEKYETRIAPVQKSKSGHLFTNVGIANAVESTLKKKVKVHSRPQKWPFIAFVGVE